MKVQLDDSKKLNVAKDKLMKYVSVRKDKSKKNVANNNEEEDDDL